MVRSEQDPMPGIAAHVIEKLGRIAADLVSRRVDKDVRIFHHEREHLAQPWHADMAAENAKLRKLQRDPVEIGNRPPRLRLAQGTCVSNLRAKGNVELAAFRK